MSGELSTKQQAFCREYLIDLNATQSAIRAGYSVNGASVQASRLLANAKIQAEIARLTEKRFKKLDIDADALIDRASQILTADPRELTGHFVGPCRYCWGEEHDFQWKTPREFQAAVEKAANDGEPIPNDNGGYGYRLTDKPSPDCPECAGLGVPYTRFADTRALSPQAALLFEGVKETRNGIEFQMADKAKMFDVLAKHHGLLKERIEHGVTDGLAELLGRVQGTAFPIASSYSNAEDDDA